MGTDPHPSPARPPPRTVLWALLALCAALAGCGGGADTADEPAANPSPAAGTRTVAAAAAAPAVVGRELRRRLSGDLRAAASDAGASAGVGLVSMGGRPAWSVALGRARRDDVFAVASITKTFVAVLTLRLVEQGRLGLEDQVGRWLGADVGKDVRAVTIGQLLGHTSDIADRPSPAQRAALRDPGHRWTERELLRPIRRAEDPQGAFTYANGNYLLLGAILRRAGGLGTEALLRREITAPLGLERTSFRRPPALAGRMPGRGRARSDASGELFTDGGLVSSAPDLARFLHALVIDGRLLQPDSLRQMLAPGPDGRYGLGVMELSPTSACRLYGHVGAMPGWSSTAVADPASGIVTVVLMRGPAEEAAADGTMLVVNALRQEDVLPCG